MYSLFDIRMGQTSCLGYDSKKAVYSSCLSVPIVIPDFDKVNCLLRQERVAWAIQDPQGEAAKLTDREAV